MAMFSITDIRFEHYHPRHTLGVQESTCRISWRYQNAPQSFQQDEYEIEVFEEDHNLQPNLMSAVRRTSTTSYLVPWPWRPLDSRQKSFVRIKASGIDGLTTPWSEPARLEAGLLHRSDWQCERIAAPWGPGTTEPGPEQLYRKEFLLTGHPSQARLYITAQGVYEAQINGKRVGDYFMSPGWTTYDGRLQYQTYDVAPLLSVGRNCIGVRVGEGWFSGRIGFEGGHRNIWGPHSALMAQLEVVYQNGQLETVVTGNSWMVTKGPIRLAEIYDGEKYDATQEVPDWSSVPSLIGNNYVDWQQVFCMDPLPSLTELTAGFGGPVRRHEVVRPIEKIVTPSGRIILDFGQNLVGYVRLVNIKGSRGHKIVLSHAEVLENQELGTRPLRICKAIDEYTLKGDENGEQYEPTFTFHGFRYAQIDGWVGDALLEDSAVAVVCHTDMEKAGSFSCSDPLLNKLYENVYWGMRGNFLSVPTDCPQRDERLGWSGDLALFAPTATLIYNCVGMLKNWLIDVQYDQKILGGVPAMVTPNATLPDPTWCRRIPCAIWHDVTVLAPWALYEETGDKSILIQQYSSMTTWIRKIPRNISGATHLWDTAIFQLGVSRTR